MGEGRIVVFGGTGFLGRQICQDLVAAGHDVLVVARNESRRAPGHRFRAVDVAETEEVAEVLAAENPDAVINATGGKWGLTGCDLEASCVDATRHVLDAVQKSGVVPRLVHLGSVLESVAADDVYARLKAAATEAVLSAADAGAVDAVVLRLANVAGPGAPVESLLGLVADRLAAAARRGESAVIELSALHAHRDYVNVRDVSAAVRAATQVAAQREPIAIGRGESVPVRALVAMLIEVSGVRASVVELPAPDPGTGDRTRVDPRPARELLGWTPRWTLRDSVHELWRAAVDPEGTQPS